MVTLMQWFNISGCYFVVEFSLSVKVSGIDGGCFAAARVQAGEADDPPRRPCGWNGSVRGDGAVARHPR